MIDKEFEQESDVHAQRYSLLDDLRKYTGPDAVKSDQVQARYSRSDAVVAAMAAMGWMGDEWKEGRLRVIKEKLQTHNMIIVIGSPLRRSIHWFQKTLSEFPIHYSMDFGAGIETRKIEPVAPPSKLFIEPLNDRFLLDEQGGIDVRKFAAWSGYRGGKSYAISHMQMMPRLDSWHLTTRELGHGIRPMNVETVRLTESLKKLAQVAAPAVFHITPANQPASKRGRRFLHPDPASRQARYSAKRKR